MSRKPFYKMLADRFGDPERWADRVESALKLHGISKARLARRAGYHPTHLSAWLNGRRAPLWRTMATIDEALDELVDETQQLQEA